MQLLITLDSNLSRWQGTQFMMDYDVYGSVSVRANGIIISSEQDILAILEADSRVATIATFVPAPLDWSNGDAFGQILDDIGVVSVVPARPTEWEMRGSRNGE